MGSGRKMAETLSASRQKRKKKSGAWVVAEKVLEVLTKPLLLFGLPILVLVAGIALFMTFKQKYYAQNDVFLVYPRDIVVRGNATLSRALLLETFGLTKPVNGFDVVKSDIVSRLRNQMPLLKTAQMTFEPGKGLELWVEERTPLARIAGQPLPLVVDEEGVCFICVRAYSGYPEISGFDAPEAFGPASRLPDATLCMLRLIKAASLLAREERTRPVPSIRRVTMQGTEPDDGLLVTLADGRKVIIAWEGMATERAPSEGMMRRWRNVMKLLRDPRMEGKRHLNAMALDRVAVSD